MYSISSYPDFLERDYPSFKPFIVLAAGLAACAYAAFKRLTQPLPPPPPLTAEQRELRVYRDPKVIERKLQKQKMYANEQMRNESDKEFIYKIPSFLERVKNFFGSEELQIKTETEQTGPYEIGVAHCQGKRPTMEDEHLNTAFTVTDSNGAKHQVQFFAIFDGHGSKETARTIKNYLPQYLKVQLSRTDLSDTSIWNALKIGCMTTNEKLKEIEVDGGSTATMALIVDGSIWCANVGDSRTILVEDNGSFGQLSEDAKPTDPRYAKGIYNRGNVIWDNRVNGRLAVARAFGDFNVGVISARPKITKTKLPSKGHLVLACDGVWDVGSTRQVAQAIYKNRTSTPIDLAKNIVHSAFLAGSMDNLSALVVKLG